MIMNLDYDLSQPLASALKGKAPFVGLPIPGHAPLIFNRKRLAAGLSGVKPINIEVLCAEGGNDRWLRVEGVVKGVNGGIIRTKMTILALKRGIVMRDASFQKYRESAQVPVVKVRNPLAKFDKAIHKIEREIAKMGKKPVSENPTLPRVQTFQDQSSWYAQQFVQWEAQRTLRGKVGALAAKCARGEMTNVQLYRALSALGVNLTKWADVSNVDRERTGVDDFSKYLKNLYKYCGLGVGYCYRGSARPTLYNYDRELVWGIERFNPTLNWQSQHKMLSDQLTEIHRMRSESAVQTDLKIAA